MVGNLSEDFYSKAKPIININEEKYLKTSTEIFKDHEQIILQHYGLW